MSTLYVAFLDGVTLDNPLTAGATTLNSAALATMPPISAPDYMWLVLDPDGANGIPEITKVTGHGVGATSCTIVRGQQTAYGASIARSHPVSTTWVVADTPDDMVRRFTVATSTTRPPGFVGQVVAETDTFKLSQYQSATTGWTPPWNLPWGRIAGASRATNFTPGAGAGPFNILSVTVPALVANRLHRVTAGVPLLQSNVATDFVYAQLKTAAADLTIRYVNVYPSGNGSIDVVLPDVASASLTGATLTLAIGRFGGSGTLAFVAASDMPVSLVVEDIGPAGVPA